MQLQGIVELGKPALLAALELVASADQDKLPTILSVGSEIVALHARPIRRETFNDLTFGLGMVTGAAYAIHLQTERAMGAELGDFASRPSTAAQSITDLEQLVEMIEAAAEYSSTQIVGGGDMKLSGAAAAQLAAVLVAGAAARRMLDILADRQRFYAETEGETFQ